jgi:hypothetical protein
MSTDGQWYVIKYLALLGCDTPILEPLSVFCADYLRNFYTADLCNKISNIFANNKMFRRSYDLEEIYTRRNGYTSCIFYQHISKRERFEGFQLKLHRYQLDIDIITIHGQKRFHAFIQNPQINNPRVHVKFREVWTGNAEMNTESDFLNNLFSNLTYFPSKQRFSCHIFCLVQLIIIWLLVQWSWCRKD